MDNFPDPETLEDLTPIDLKNYSNSKAYEKYVLPIIEREKLSKKKCRSEWFWLKGLLIVNTILAGISAICGILSLLK